MQQPADERFQEIYARHRAAVVAYARRRVAADAVDDVVAETFLVCWRKLGSVPDETLPWLYGVARKTLANRRRAAARQTPRALVEVSEGLSLCEAATVLGCSTVACRVRFHRAKRRLAELLEAFERHGAVARPQPDPKGATQ